MNPNIRLHTDLVFESHRGLEYGTKQSLTLNQPGSELTTRELAAHCVGEINNFRRGEPGSEKYSIELLRRAIVQGEEEARVWIERCFSEQVLSWCSAISTCLSEWGYDRCTADLLTIKKNSFTRSKRVRGKEN